MTIPATADIFAAGSSAVPSLSGGGGTLPPLLPVTAGDTLSFAASGTVNCGPGPQAGPDGAPCLGNQTTKIAGYGGISGITDSTSALFLTGVFISNAVPASPPPALDFSPRAAGGISQDFSHLAPSLGQTFFIGDGRAENGTVQQFTVPSGATRLYLGFADAYGLHGTPGAYGDNTGQLSVEVTTGGSSSETTSPACTPVADASVNTLAHGLQNYDQWSSLPAATLADPRTAGALFNTLTPSQVQNVLVPAVTPRGPGYSDAVWNALVKDLESCSLSETLASALVSTPASAAALNDIYGRLRPDAAAAVGLFEPLTLSDIVAGEAADPGVLSSANGVAGRKLDDEYGALAGVALAHDVRALVNHGRYFSLPVASLLDSLSANSFTASAPKLRGGAGALDLGGYDAQPLPAAVRAYIESSEPSPPPPGTRFANDWIDHQLTGDANAANLTAPNDIYDAPRHLTAGEYYFYKWAADAATLTYLVAQPVARLDAASMLGIDEGTNWLTGLACTSLPLKDIGCTALDFANLTKEHFRHADIPSVVRDLVGLGSKLPALLADDESKDDLLGPFGVGLALLPLSPPTTAQIQAADRVAGTFLCYRERDLEESIIPRGGKTLANGKRGYRAGSALLADAYLYKTVRRNGRDQSSGVITFSYANGSDTHSPAFSLLNDVQALWRTLADGKLPAADYQACGLGGENPVNPR